MKRRIIEALTYPRILMTSNMDVRNCPTRGYFNAPQPLCQLCAQGEECLWLNQNDEFSALMQQPVEILQRSLLFSIDYVDAHIACLKHNSRRCICETCSWVRDARHLARCASDSIGSN